MDVFYRSKYKREDFSFANETVELYLKNVIANVNKHFSKTYVIKMKDIRKMKKWQTENSKTFKISEISEILFRDFSFPIFPFFPKAKIENSDLKSSIKKHRQWNV